MDKLLTNNPLAIRLFVDVFDVEFHEGSAKDVLVAARDYVHQGHGLLTHPLASSIPLKDTPFRSLLVSERPASLDVAAVGLIESAIERYSQVNAQNREIPQNIADDFMAIDCDMIASRKSKK